MCDAAVQGKLLLLITNSDYEYTNCMMKFAYDRYLAAEGMQWRDLFDMVSREFCPCCVARLPACVRQVLHKQCSCTSWETLCHMSSSNC